MLFLMIFSTVALGFYASVTTSTQVSKSECDVAETLLASESGLGFVRHHLANLNLPYGTTQASLLENVAACLARSLDGTTNMGPYRVVVDAGTIYLPSRNDWIALDRTQNTRFRATITQTSGTTTLVATVRGAAGDSAISRGVRMSFTPKTGSYALAGIQGVNMSAGAFTDSYDSSKGGYSAATAGKRGTIISNGNIVLSNTARINGDARPGPGKTVTVKDSAVVTGKKLAMPTTVNFPSVALPATYTSLGAVSRSTGVQNIPGGVYVIDSLNLSGDAVINWLGPVTIYVRNGYSVSGNVVINTYQNKPSNRTLYFLPTCATATWSGSNVCVGELYAPDTDFYISGGVQKLGRITARTITNSSTGGMHSDDAMASPGGSGDYAADVSSYEEVP